MPRYDVAIKRRQLSTRKYRIQAPVIFSKMAAKFANSDPLPLVTGMPPMVVPLPLVTRLNGDIISRKT